MSRAERVVLVFGAAACLGMAGLSCGDDDGGATEGGGTGSGDQDIAKVAMALTGGVDFENSSVVAALLPDPDNDTVELDQSATTLSLEPGGGAQLLPLEVTNPDSADTQVEAVLLQFEGADEHIEVEVEGSEDENETFELRFTVDAGICDELCNDVVRLKLAQAVRMTDGSISEHLERMLSLDCSDDGDPDACEESDEPKAGSSGGSDEPDAGGGSSGGSGEAAKRADSFAMALIPANAGLCTSCTELGGVAACDAIYPRSSITCLKEAITAATDGESVTAINDLTTTLMTVRAACSVCDMTQCPTTILGDAVDDFPAALHDAFLECAGGSLPPAQPDAGL